MDNNKLSKGTEPRLKQALDRAVQWLLERQNVEGWWCGELETNVFPTMALAGSFCKSDSYKPVPPKKVDPNNTERNTPVL